MKRVCFRVFLILKNFSHIFTHKFIPLFLCFVIVFNETANCAWAVKKTNEVFLIAEKTKSRELTVDSEFP
jgi:hypothetical protein